MVLNVLSLNKVIASINQKINYLWNKKLKATLSSIKNVF